MSDDPDTDAILDLMEESLDAMDEVIEAADEEGLPVLANSVRNSRSMVQSQYRAFAETAGDGDDRFEPPQFTLEE